MACLSLSEEQVEKAVVPSEAASHWLLDIVQQTDMFPGNSNSLLWIDRILIKCVLEKYCILLR